MNECGNHKDELPMGAATVGGRETWCPYCLTKEVKRLQNVERKLVEAMWVISQTEKGHFTTAELGRFLEQHGGPHIYWGAGEADCPKDIKAPNGELHTLKCKVCGEENPRTPVCLANQRLSNPDNT